MHTVQAEKLRQAHGLLQLAERAAFVGTWALDPATGAIDWSDQLAAIHEAPPGFRPPVEDPFGFYAPEWRQKTVALVDQCASTGTPFDEEMQVVTLKGRRASASRACPGARASTGEGFVARAMEFARHGAPCTQA